MKIYQLIKIDDNDGYFETQVLVQIFSDLDSLKRYVRDFYNLDNCDFYNEIDEYIKKVRNISQQVIITMN